MCVFRGTGERSFPSFSIGADVTPKKLEILIQTLIKQSRDQDDDDDDEDDDLSDRPFLFYLGGEEISVNLGECLDKLNINKERTLPILFKPQAVFK